MKVQLSADIAVARTATVRSEVPEREHAKEGEQADETIEQRNR